MKSKVIYDPILGKKTKLIYGGVKEFAMVRESTGNPQKLRNAPENYGGAYSKILNPEKDPDRVIDFIWINSEFNIYENIISLAYSIPIYFSEIVYPRLVKGGESVPREMDAYYKTAFFRYILKWLFEFKDIPVISREDKSFQDKIKNNIRYKLEFVKRFEVDEKLGTASVCCDQFKVKLKSDMNDCKTIEVLFHEVVHLVQKRFGIYGYEDIPSKTVGELTEYLFRMHFYSITNQKERD